MIQATVCFLLKDDEILLAMKKRGFGVGKWNGSGGKMKAGETPVSTTIREAKEEIGVDIEPNDLEKVAENEFNFLEHPDWDIFCHVYFVRNWQGEPSESEEMKPQWFKIKDIPYDKMWADDIYWLGRVLSGEKLRANFKFSGTGDVVAEHSVETVDSFV